MAKYGLKGFANLGYAIVSEDTASTYTAGERTELVGARSCTVEDSRSEYKVAGDDGIYAQGSNYESTTLNISVNELTLKQLSELTGAELSSDTQELGEGELDNAPQLLLSMSALRIDNGHRLYKYMNAKLTNYKVDLKAKLDTGNEVNQYQLTFICTARKGKASKEKTPKVRYTKDINAGEAVTWLTEVPAVVGG